MKNLSLLADRLGAFLFTWWGRVLTGQGHMYSPNFDCLGSVKLNYFVIRGYEYQASLQSIKFQRCSKSEKNQFVVRCKKRHFIQKTALGIRTLL